MAQRITRQMLESKVKRVSDHCEVELKIEHIYDAGYRVTNKSESINLSDIMKPHGVWQWLDAFEKGYDVAYGVFKLTDDQPGSKAVTVLASQADLTPSKLMRELT